METQRRWTAACAAALIVLGVTACRSATRSDRASDRPEPATPSQSTEQVPEAVGRFLETYVRSDGRVVRADQGGDTVSEGQAYAMLLAVAADDEDAFERIWTWTARNLERPDGLFSWHWSGGKITDEQSAADADLGIAWGLGLAAERFQRAEYRTRARAVADAILSVETTSADGEPVLVAGPWARRFPAIVNPSYFTPDAMTYLAAISGDRDWERLRGASSRLVTSLTRSPPHLPPDWATVGADGTAMAGAAPGSGDRPRYGWDAVRVPLWTASSCASEDRTIAARMWTFLERAGDAPAAVYTLGGDPIDEYTSAVALVGAAAAAHAAGDASSAAALLDTAEAKDRGAPTYFGGALVAFGRVLLQTRLITDCDR